ncbi:MAG: hypothetical protein EOO68_11800 [Moraxellaceae bacterium]|nr:MAG: hypothetical protein EOO68_11800 [Moraxellaceae bacterium]
MTDTFTASLQIEPELKKALDRYQEVLTAANGDVQLLINSFNPMQSLQQISSASTEFYSGLDWAKVVQNSLNPSTYVDYFSGLTEIQNAAANELSAKLQSLFNVATKDGQAFTSQLSEATSPQQVLANAINIGLDAYAGIKTNLTEQSRILASIQSALVAFGQQSLSKLSGDEVV